MLAAGISERIAWLGRKSKRDGYLEKKIKMCNKKMVEQIVEDRLLVSTGGYWDETKTEYLMYACSNYQY